jgi:predicted O-methyltransferase YrrM
MSLRARIPNRKRGKANDCEMTDFHSSLNWVYANCSEETIQREHAEALHGAVRRYRPNTVIEVGLANGASAVAMASALESNGGGRLISIDPNQRKGYDSRGLAALERGGLARYHELIEEPSYLALPSLLRRGVKAEFAYIDGWHSFDYALVDFFYADKLLAPGGIVGFNDAGSRAVDKVLKFVGRYRKYIEIDVGLRRDYRGRNPLFTLRRRLLGLQAQDRYFQKLCDWEPRWDFYVSF